MALITLTAMVATVAWLAVRTDMNTGSKTPAMKPVRVRVDEQQRRRPGHDR